MNLSFFYNLKDNVYIRQAVYKTSGPNVMKLFLAYSTQLSMKFIMLINVKMPTIVGILTFISRINTEPECFKVMKVFIFYYISFYKHLIVHTQLSLA